MAQPRSRAGLDLGPLHVLFPSSRFNEAAACAPRIFSPPGGTQHTPAARSKLLLSELGKSPRNLEPSCTPSEMHAIVDAPSVR